MAASDNLNPNQSGRYVRVHRGFAGVKHNEVDTGRLGVHWAQDDNSYVARSFATQAMYTGEQYYPEQQKGTVLTGYVHKRHLLEPGSEEHEKWANMGEGAIESERETPLRPGTPVHLVGAEDFNGLAEYKEVKFPKPKRGRV